MDEMQATNPTQYDSPELDWTIHGAESRPTRIFFREQLGTITEGDYFIGKRVLDIGSGVGQLFNWLKQKGAEEIIGIDPSENNIQFSKSTYPEVEVKKSTLHEFSSENTKEFDAAVAILVFEHIENLNEAFADVYSLLNTGGEFFLIFEDKDYSLITDSNIRGTRVVAVEILREFENGATETKTVRKYEDGRESVIYDILRPKEQILKAARESGLEVFAQKELLGPIGALPENRKFCFCHLVAFRKN